jgi:hypothetical protein
MDGIGAATLRSVQYFVGPQIGFRHRSRSYTYSLIGHADMQGICVCFAENRNSAVAKFTRGADNPHRNLAAICNQYFLKVCHS